MGVCIAKLPHTCGTTDGLQVFADQETGIVNGFCFSCSTFIKDPYGEEKTIEDVDFPEPKTEAEVREQMNEIVGLSSVDCPTRRLRGTDLEPFGVKVALSERDGKTPSVCISLLLKRVRSLVTMLKP